MNLNFIYEAKSLSSKVILVTPEIAKELLKNNIKNRDENHPTLRTYISDMRANMWKENGESIIIDRNGHIKDGQHRLMAIVSTGRSQRFVVAYGVDPSVMDTIDTGKNRSLKDVLQISGVNTNLQTVATLTGTIAVYHKTTVQETDKHVGSYLTNYQGLRFYEDNAEELQNLATIVQRLYKSLPIRSGMFSPKDIGLILYVIADGFNVKDTHIKCFKQMSGIDTQSGTSGAWINKKMQQALNNPNISYKLPWKLKVAIKSWNLMVTGQDVNVKYINVENTEDIGKPLPMVSDEIVHVASKALRKLAGDVASMDIKDLIYENS